jgi:energy-coupling factor transporter ATP-binding protein EcfA2
VIKSLRLRSFTVFEDATLRFGRHLNVFIGENGSGKTHLLKAAYSVLSVLAGGARSAKGRAPTKRYLEGALARKLTGVFRPDDLCRLLRDDAGAHSAEVELRCIDGKLDTAFRFDQLATSDVEITVAPTSWADKPPVFLPTRELLTIYPGFVSLYETTSIPFEETWRDACILLGAPLVRGPRELRARELLQPLEAAMGGRIELTEGGQFYLVTERGKMEIYLVAEGLRKLGMVARLIANGVLLDKGCLFWDEPETNLNPKLVKDVARSIWDVGKGGVQVFVATHNLFLMRELYLLQQTESAVDVRCFGLDLDEAGGARVRQGKTMDEVGDIRALDEELLQSDRYLDVEASAGASR